MSKEIHKNEYRDVKLYRKERREIIKSTAGIGDLNDLTGVERSQLKPVKGDKIKKFKTSEAHFARQRDRRGKKNYAKLEFQKEH
jgi:hypothetical protein